MPTWVVTIPYFHKFTVEAETEAAAIEQAHNETGVIVGYDDDQAEVEPFTG